MASLWRHPQSKFWVACFTDARGKQRKKSTRLTDKRLALLVAQSWEQAEAMSKAGYLTAEEQYKAFFDSQFQFLFGKKPQLDLTIRDWLTAWLANEKGAVAEATHKRYSGVIASFLKFLDSRAELRLEALSSKDAIAYRDSLLEKGQSERNVNLVVRRILSRPFKAAWEQGRIPFNPILTVRHLQADRAEKGTFTPQEVAKLIAAAPDKEWKTLLRLAYFTGQRLGDLSSLKWGDVNLDEGSIVFVPRKTRARTGGAKLIVPIHAELLEHLIAICHTDDPKRLVMPKLSQIPVNGKTGLSLAFKGIMKDAGIDGGLARERRGKGGKSISRLSFQSLRHSFISSLANAGVDRELRMKLVGHLTSEAHAVYSHVELETVRSALAKLDRLPPLNGEEAGP